ncbi:MULTISPECIES: class II aldolase/adducin family protein [Dysgonomonas]|uniref:class II aldolase/adducin family protein n=1 Tax=Dysgonomonas TaxID=156973 RepID=UPI0009284EBA|nr:MULTISPECIES: class II aldolase/adducin family protein [Dysgonomonas]MBN9303065.1 class II aldolase/adducin family protein [Dysgonomonas mossii]MBS5796160.1 class II aldolase/adducin family protein [Dysgonomonas mossii]MBS7110920.1 class II aldolase/adducin family protein [Dysgonomonas mossii]OJX61019.1 MAG: aldolase [Dysgonomonas sp. 37-18]
MINAEYIERFIEAAHRVGQERLQLCSSGNLSWRVNKDLALVSGTGSWLPRITKENVAICNISTGMRVDGPKPSMESVFHLGVLRQRKDMNVVLHFQSEFATIVSCMKNKPKSFNVVAEVPCYCGKEIAVIPYYRPGSKELADAVTHALTDHDCVLMSKHGQAVCGKDFDDAFQKAVFLELACSIIVRAGEGNYDILSDDEIRDLEVYILGKTQK